VCAVFKTLTINIVIFDVLYEAVPRDLQRSSSVENTYGCQSGIYNHLVHSDSIPTDHSEDIYDHIHDDSSEQQYEVARRGIKQNHDNISFE
jgi:hypothetical protein